MVREIEVWGISQHIHWPVVYVNCIEEYFPQKTQWSQHRPSAIISSAQCMTTLGGACSTNLQGVHDLAKVPCSYPSLTFIHDCMPMTWCTRSLGVPFALPFQMVSFHNGKRTIFTSQSNQPSSMVSSVTAISTILVGCNCSDTNRNICCVWK